MPSNDDDSPNAVLLGILRQKYETADSNGWKKSQTYKKAYDNLKKVPHRISIYELESVKGIGAKIAEELIAGYRRYCDETGEEFLQDDTWKKGSKKRTTGAEAELDADGPATATKKRKPKEYMPKRRSGAYALLLGLYIQDQRFGEGKYISKEDLIAISQEHSESSFTENARGSHYSAWGSMKMLKDKNLVHAKGRPEKFTLTDSGVEVAHKIAKAEGLAGDRESPERGGGDDEEEDFPQQPIIQARSDAKKVPTISPAAKRVLAGIAPLKASNSLFDDDEEWPDFTQTSISRLKSPPKASSSRTLSASTAASRNASKSSTSTSRTTSKSTAIDLMSDDEGDTVPPLGKAPPANSRFARQPSVPSQVSLIAQPHSRAGSIAPEDFPTFTPATFAPGSFDVQMVIDNREKSSRANPDYMQDTLYRKHQIQALTRPLSVGDVVWIAKHKTSGKEVMLDFIVERKRLDDLIGSIKDGRYKEQKSRLRKSGMTNVVYLIEEYVIAGGNERGMGGVPGVGLEAIMTAIASMQVVEGIFVKRTKKVDDTLRYLASVTERLQKSLENQTLYIIPSSVLDIKTYPAFKAHLAHTQPDKSYHVEYSVFQDMLDKTAETDLRAVFIRMLMCIKGITAQKAVQIQGVYGTPAGLAKAYRDCDSKEARDTLIMREVTGVGKKATSKLISTKVAEMWAS